MANATGGVMRPEYQPHQSLYPNFHPLYRGGSCVDVTPPQLTVRFGQRTFDAEGTEQPGRYFSREIHWPGGSSGVTIGRGYDMGQRTRLQVQRELSYAGMNAASAEALSMAAGYRGAAAERFVSEYRGYLPGISLDVQQALFEEITTPEIIADVKRILSKVDVVNEYGRANWDDLSAPVQELLFDLRYRGDYRADTRKDLQPLIVAQDYRGLITLVSDIAYWKGNGVPEHRAKARIAIIRGE